MQVSKGRTHGAGGQTVAGMMMKYYLMNIYAYITLVMVCLGVQRYCSNIRTTRYCANQSPLSTTTESIFYHC